MNVKNKENSKEKFDQHFMINQELLKRIVHYAKLSKDNIVLEIGPGKGALTKNLIKKANIIAIELDKDLFSDLKKRFSNNIKIMQGNALSLIGKLHFDKIVANIPYSISEPLLRKILTIQPKIVVFTVGENFVEYINNNLLLHNIYSVEVLENVSKTDFDPIPKTDSVVIRLILKNNEISLIFQDLLKQKDKKLKNALIKTLEAKLTKNQLREKIKDFNFMNKSILNIQNKDLEELYKFIKTTYL